MAEYIKGLVSVVIPTYKRSKMLTRAIESVLNQTYADLELLLVNDNDPDDAFTTEIKNRIQKYKNDSRLHFILQEKHINGAVARNVGIKQAKGEYVAFLDDDDWWESNKLEEQVKALEKLPEDYGVVSCKVKRWKDGKCFECQPLYPNGYVYKKVLMLAAQYTTATLVFRHNDLDKAGYFDEKLLRHQDLQLLVDFTHQYKMFVVDQYLHNTDVSDASNRPDATKLIEAKKAFFQSVAPVIETLTPAEKKQVKVMHNAEVGYIHLKNKETAKAIPCFLSLLTSPTAFRYEIKKVMEKKNSQAASKQNV